MEQEQELIVVENLNPTELFSDNGANDLLKDIEKKVKSIVPDVNTAKGRKEIAGIAYKISQSKTHLDNLGKTLVQDWKKQAKVVDNERKKIREFLDNLKTEFREPLTKWEQAELDRVAKYEASIEEIREAGNYSVSHWMEISVQTMTDRLMEIEAEVIDESWEEFADEAAQVKSDAISSIKQAIEKRRLHDTEQAELQDLRDKQAKQEQKEKDEKLRKEGEERARIEAETAAQAERDRVEQERKDAEAAGLKRERDAEAARVAAIEAKEKAEREAEEAKEAAERKIKEAAQAERDRIESDRIAEEVAAKDREADKKHRDKINNSAAGGFVTAGIDSDQAKKIVTAIAKGQIPYVTISY